MFQAILLLGIYLREMKTCSHRKLYTDVHSTIADKSLKMETVLIHQLMNGHKNVIEPYSGMLFGMKNEVLAHVIAWMDTKQFADSKKPV